MSTLRTAVLKSAVRYKYNRYKILRQEKFNRLKHGGNYTHHVL